MKPRVRIIKKLFPARPTLEGAGVHLKRAFAQSEVPQFDPFLLLDDFGSANPDDYRKGFPWHPHRGIETVTYVIEGEVEHQDSLGHKGTIESGDVQWMTAGSGIIHQEMPRTVAPVLQGFQLWINLPAAQKMTKPTYRALIAKDIPVVSVDGNTVKVIAGEFKHRVGPAINLYTDVRYFDLVLVKNSEFLYQVPSRFCVFVYVFDGTVNVAGGEKVSQRMVALLSEGDFISLKASSESARCLLLAGEPMGQSVAWGGPIVMNTESEIETAFTEYRNGTFLK